MKVETTKFSPQPVPDERRIIAEMNDDEAELILRYLAMQPSGNFRNYPPLEALKEELVSAGVRTPDRVFNDWWKSLQPIVRSMLVGVASAAGGNLYALNQALDAVGVDHNDAWGQHFSWYLRQHHTTLGTD